MKKKRISTYITLLTLLSSMLLYSPTLAAQEKKTTIEEEKVPFYQGTTTVSYTHLTLPTT